MAKWLNCSGTGTIFFLYVISENEFTSKVKMSRNPADRQITDNSFASIDASYTETQAPDWEELGDPWLVM